MYVQFIFNPCGVHTARFSKYVWPFYNIMHERVKYHVVFQSQSEDYIGEDDIDIIQVIVLYFTSLTYFVTLCLENFITEKIVKIACRFSSLEISRLISASTKGLCNNYLRLKNPASIRILKLTEIYGILNKKTEVYLLYLTVTKITTLWE